MRHVLPLLLAAGCFQVHHFPVCEVVDATDVADDEVTPVGTAEELLATVVLDEQLPATWWDGSPAEADVVVERGAGTSQWVEQEVGDRTSRSWGFGSTHPAIAVICEDALQVPIDASVRSTDDQLELRASGVAEGVHLALEAPMAGARFPATENDPDDFDDTRAFLHLTYDEAGLVEGTAGWSGSRETEETSMSLAEYVLDLHRTE